MKIHFENVDFGSRSGPNGFGLKLARELSKSGHSVVSDGQDVRLTFIQGSNSFRPNVLRLDGIYFNSEQDWLSMNEPIRRSYDFANAVIVQSEFNKSLTEKYFGLRENVHVIHNGTSLEDINRISPAQIATGIPREKVWMCASSWRPHKRLADNIRLFLELSEPDHVMLVAGKDAHQYAGSLANHPRIELVGDLNWVQLISCMKASGNFVHLAWLDHCPNVVVDARAAGCKIYCSNSGGTKEVAGPDAMVLEEEVWQFEPVLLYHPPTIQRFENLLKLNCNSECSEIDITIVANRYLKIICDTVGGEFK